jgi:hypothetical protein
LCIKTFSGYQEAVHTKYLSPKDSADPRFCDDVTISNSGTFLGTKYGQWEGSYGFTYANGSYVLSITNYQVTQEEFTATMDTVYEDMKAIGKYMEQNDLAVNLLLWMSWVEVATHNFAQRFHLSGSSCSCSSLLVFFI